MEETGPKIKLLSQKTFTGSQEKSAAGFKTNKERTTVGVCCNVAGTDWTVNKPHGFKRIKILYFLYIYVQKNQHGWRFCLI